VNDYLRILQKQPGNPNSTRNPAAAVPEHMAMEFMKKHSKDQSHGATFLAAVAALTFAVAAPTQAQTITAEEIVKKELNAFYYAGKDMSARVSMKLINGEGSVRERDMTLLRMNKGDIGDQQYMMAFNAPADVRGMSFLISKYAKADDDRWMYIPALKAVKRIAADDKKSSFVGSDFTYEDVSGRDLNEEQHTLLKSDDLGGRKVYVVESKPKGNTNYAKRTIWVDQERWLPLKEEYFDAQGKLLRSFSADKVEQISGQWTITSRTMKNSQTGHRSEVVFKDVQYNVGLSDDIFTERNLKNPGLGAKR
jgi:outer membrane lipoprotein-sorting protein